MCGDLGKACCSFNVVRGLCQSAITISVPPDKLPPFQQPLAVLDPLYHLPPAAAAALPEQLAIIDDLSGWSSARSALAFLSPTGQASTLCFCSLYHSLWLSKVCFKRRLQHFQSALQSQRAIQGRLSGQAASACTAAQAFEEGRRVDFAAEGNERSGLGHGSRDAGTAGRWP